MRASRVVSVLPLGVFSAFVAVGCGATEPETGAVVRQELSVPPTVRFDQGFGPVTPSQPLVAGGQVRIAFDTRRFYDVIKGNGSFSYFASAHHCYGYGCCEVAFSEVQVAYRFRPNAPFTSENVTLDVAADTSLGSGIAAKPFELDVAIPSDAERLELYFSVPGYELHTWYCGCDTACQEQSYNQQHSGFREYRAYDSAWGQNYVFPVSPAPAEATPTVLSFDGAWNEGASAPLRGGETVLVRYDLARLPGCRGQYMGRDAFGVTMAYRFSPDAEPQFLGVTESRPDGVVVSRDAELVLPASGGQLEAWFYVSSRWGCIQYDSDFSRNYRFPFAAP